MPDTPDALPWHRSTRCGDNACVEVAVLDEEVLVRDSKAPDGPVLAFSRAQWQAFLLGVRDGEFDR
jgi:Domain of unknown function (DUF397)